MGFMFQILEVSRQIILHAYRTSRLPLEIIIMEILRQSLIELTYKLRVTQLNRSYSIMIIITRGMDGSC